MTIARQRVVIELASSLDAVTADMSPKHFLAVRHSLRAFMSSSVARELVFHEPLRLRQVGVTPRVMWLVQAVGPTATIEWADRRLADDFESLLVPGMGDMRELVRAVGVRATLKVKRLKRSRSLLPLGGWASDVKLGAVSLELAREILRNPDEWPGDLVQRAAEKVGTRMASQSSTLASTARADGWFS